MIGLDLGMMETEFNFSFHSDEDLGPSKHFSFGEVHSEKVGTLCAIAPKIIKGSHNESCDIWAVDVATCLLLSGKTPFGGVDGEDLQEVRIECCREKSFLNLSTFGTVLVTWLRILFV